MERARRSRTAGATGNGKEVVYAAGERCRIALLYPGDRAARDRSAPEESRFLPLFNALADLGAAAEPAVYHDDFHDEVREQLVHVDGVLVWMNPIHEGRDRSVLDAMLREVASGGVFVSAHPDVILGLGTKEILYRTRDMGWGGETRLYRTMGEMREALPTSLSQGARVLKRLRGQSGDGVWKVELDGAAGGDCTVRVRHAQRGSPEETLGLAEFCGRCDPYFERDGGMVDQAWQPRITEGMVRCYLVHGRVEGFGLQAINALYPAASGARAGCAPLPGPRLYHPPTLPAWQALKQRVEEEWVPEVRARLRIEEFRLPVLWDCDFLLGPRTPANDDSYVLCEVNASSVSPFPESAVMPVARAVFARANEARLARR